MFADDVAERKKYLSKLILEKQNALKKAPEGTLRLSGSSRRRMSYRAFSKADKKQVYLGRKDLDLKAGLAQKDYDIRIMKAAGRELELLTSLENLLKSGSIDSIYPELDPLRKTLVSPVRLPDQEYVQQWRSVEYEGRPFSDDSTNYYTDLGERVRSKSELILADLLKRHRIPYRYEYPLTLKNGIVIYPDFTVLNVREQKEYIWEHFGMMDDHDYRENVFRKLQAYADSRIFPGDPLIITYESQHSRPGKSDFEKLIDKYLK